MNPTPEALKAVGALITGNGLEMLDRVHLGRIFSTLKMEAAANEDILNKTTKQLLY